MKFWSGTDGPKSFTRLNLSVPNQLFGTRTFFIRAVPKIFGRVNGALVTHATRCKFIDLEAFMNYVVSELCYVKNLKENHRRCNLNQSGKKGILSEINFRLSYVRNPKQSWILNSTTKIPDFGYWIPDLLSVELGSRMPRAKITWIPV